jgi:Uncharacterized protein conserved in bacteria
MRQQSDAEKLPSMRFIVHADDCGLTRQISQDIFACLAQGPLNSVSVIMGGSGAAQSLQQLAAMPSVRVCLHLNILKGAARRPFHKCARWLMQMASFGTGLGRCSVTLPLAVAPAKRPCFQPFVMNLKPR